MTSESDQLIEALRKDGFKITAVRENILRTFFDIPYPLSVPELISKLQKFDLNPNKTTLYREIDFLIEQEIIQEIDFGEGKKRYEIKSEHCHHHLVCTKCQKIECVELEDNMHEIVERLEEKTDFKIYEHMLEFFGLCKECRDVKA